MLTFFLLILYLLIFISEIVLLVFAVKRKHKKLWIALFSFEIASLIFSQILSTYFNSLPGYGIFPGLSYLAEILLSILAFFLYIIMLLISACIRIVTFELNLKKQGKEYANPLGLILAVVLITIGVFSVNYEVSENWDKKETTGIVTDFKDVNIGGEIKQEPIITFYVDGKEYQDTYYIENVSIGDELDIYYYPNDYYSDDDSIDNSYSITLFCTNSKYIYIPCFSLSIIIIWFTLNTDKKVEKDLRADFVPNEY